MGEIADNVDEVRDRRSLKDSIESHLQYRKKWILDKDFYPETSEHKHPDTGQVLASDAGYTDEQEEEAWELAINEITTDDEAMRECLDDVTLGETAREEIADFLRAALGKPRKIKTKERVYNYLKERCKKTPLAIPIREIMAGTRSTSTQTVFKAICDLDKEGLIVKEKISNTYRYTIPEKASVNATIFVEDGLVQEIQCEDDFTAKVVYKDKKDASGFTITALIR